MMETPTGDSGNPVTADEHQRHVPEAQRDGLVRSGRGCGLGHIERYGHGRLRGRHGTKADRTRAHDRDHADSGGEKKIGTRQQKR